MKTPAFLAAVKTQPGTWQYLKSALMENSHCLLPALPRRIGSWLREQNAASESTALFQKLFVVFLIG